jgi:hypothetical protein
MSGSSEDRRLEIAAVLDEVLVCRDELSKATVPGPGSAAEHDLAHLTADLTRAVNRQIALIDLWMVVSTDQLHGLGVLIREGTTVFSLFPLIRSILEHSTAVIWVLGGEPNSRPVKASLLALRGQEELAKAASRLGGKGSPTHRDAKQRLDGLREEVRQEFGPLELEPLTINDQRLLSPTELVAHYGRLWGDERQWTGAYDYLCGTATHPALNAREYFDGEDPMGSGPAISADLLNRLLRIALVPYLKALEYVSSYLGLPAEPRELYVDRLNAVFGDVLVWPEPQDETEG